MSDMDDEDLADELRFRGWVVYRKKENPRKWVAEAQSGDGKHSLTAYAPTRDCIAGAVELAVDAYVGSNPESGPIPKWTYRFERSA